MIELCLVFGLWDGGWDGAGGYEGRKRFVCLKWASHFWVSGSLSKVSFLPRGIFLGWRLGRRLEKVAKAVGGGYCRLQMPLRRGSCLHEDSGWA